MRSILQSSVRLLAAGWLGGWLAGCGGGGGASPTVTPPVTPPAAAFGITTRVDFPGSAIPTNDATATTGYRVVNSFPALNFTAPLFIAGVPGENRNVVVEQGGRIQAFPNDSTTARATLILDLSARVLFSGEQGLLGLAFDPDFANNRFIYVHYSLNAPLRARIARFTWDATSDSVNIASERILLDVERPFTNHNGGMLAFGPDRNLYLSFGDGGSGGDPLNNAQNRNTLLGKFLRITPPTATSAGSYTIPADNPFVGQANTRSEIWAYGLRNPFRFSFDRETGALWAGDVGQNTIEEIDLITAGGNYGWRILEGTHPFNGDPTGLTLTPPVIEYDHSQGAAVIGGYVYRGSRVPSLYGQYLYGDFTSGRLWRLQFDGARVVANTEIGNVPQLTSFGEDSNGEVRMTSGAGGIFELVADSGGGAAPPTRLSDTGLFSNVGNLTPAAGVIEYTVNEPFWSDGAVKRRWFALPAGQRSGFPAGGANQANTNQASWTLPVGTVLIKHFEIALDEAHPTMRRRLETRVLARRPSGWFGLVYRWRNDGSDADLLPDQASETLSIATTTGTVNFSYEYPGRSACLRCHNTAAGDTLSLRTGQLNGAFTYPSAVTDNQLRTLNHIGLFASTAGANAAIDIGDAANLPRLVATNDTTQSLDTRARTYLDVNCAICHRPNGGTPVALDLRLQTVLTNTGALDTLPQAGDLGIANPRIVARGAKGRSVLWERMRRTDGQRMPPLASHRVDEAGLELIGQWIDGL